MKKKMMYLQLFAAAENTTVTADLEPAISVDFVSRISANMNSLMEVLGVSDLIPMAAGTTLKMWKMVKENSPAQVGEGEEIPLTKVTRKPAGEVVIEMNKYRKNTTAESIQKVGRNMAINKTDEKLVSEIQKDIKNSFYAVLKTGTGTASGTNLQTALAALWGKLSIRFEDTDVSPVYFINPLDVAEYLGNAQISTQSAFGFQYIENFLGLGTAILHSAVEQKKPIGTVKENLRGVNVPMNGEVAQAFNLTADNTGLVGMTHSTKTNNATIDTLIISGVKFFPEYVDGVFIATIA